MQRILFFTDHIMSPRSDIFTGLRERAHAYGWQVVQIEYAVTNHPAEEFIELWNPVGNIVDCARLYEPLNLEAYSAVPTVYIDPTIISPGAVLPVVRMNADSLALQAFDELRKLTPASYAFVGWAAPSTWSEEAREAFSRAVEKLGKTVHCFGGGWRLSELPSFQRRLASWIVTLPKPCGVFAANDRAAEQTLYACHAAGLSCPTEVAVVGADNDRFCCENTPPSLTSIVPDFHRAGILAADMLAGLLKSGTVKRNVRHYGIRQIVRRGSTRTLLVDDVAVLDAIELIRNGACHGLTSAQVIKTFKGGRRTAETRFRAATGHSIGDEIAEIRFARVFELLEDTSCQIGSIAAKVGWASDSFLRRAFHRRTGMTMREWRQNNRLP